MSDLSTDPYDVMFNYSFSCKCIYRYMKYIVNGLINFNNELHDTFTDDDGDPIMIF